ncbi:type II restriction endonuclease [Rhizobium sp. LjRoot254]|uniref:type II restriction endonuclease n=1 Tax=Rhizobium sp. LjRoot254 TaxID=3342297 RepID=UPI003ECC8E58
MAAIGHNRTGNPLGGNGGGEVRQGSLSDYFIGVGVKSLRGTEVDTRVSNGHELQGVDSFRVFLGTPSESVKIPVSYIWLSDDTPPERMDLTATWYDCRANDKKRTAEYRLYYPAKVNNLVYRAKTGDTLFLCQSKEGPLLALFCARGSSIEQQLLWLFGLQLVEGFDIRQNDLRDSRSRVLGLAARYILDLIGIEVISTEDTWLDLLVRRFGDRFPSTREFSALARQIARDVDSIADPDLALLEWMDLEERLFMTFERHIVSKVLEKGFMSEGKADVEGFVKFSLSVQNRRKTRAGWAFGNHIEEVLRVHDLHYKREATTEKRNGPDFLFPDETAYRDPLYPTVRLTMLGAKTSCKDRWRQVLAEADRIEIKHLLTLEPGISETQTKEMQRARLQLVLPTALHETYQPEQQKQLMNLQTFIEVVRSRQTS